MKPTPKMVEAATKALAKPLALPIHHDGVKAAALSTIKAALSAEPVVLVSELEQISNDISLVAKTAVIREKDANRIWLSGDGIHAKLLESTAKQLRALLGEKE